MVEREHEAARTGSSRTRRGRRSRRRKRSPKLAPSVIAAVLSAPVAVRSRGLSQRMFAFEASLRSQVKRALVERDVGAMVRILAFCERYGILEMVPEPPLAGGLFIIPKDWCEREWRAMFERHGPPPWRGRRSGLPGDPPKD